MLDNLGENWSARINDYNNNAAERLHILKRNINCCLSDIKRSKKNAERRRSLSKMQQDIDLHRILAVEKLNIWIEEQKAILGEDGEETGSQ